MAFDGERFGQVAEIPARDPLFLEPMPCRGERHLRRFAELLAQCGDLATRCELATLGVDDPCVEHEVRRKPIRHEDVVWNRLAQTSLQVIAKPFFERALAR